MRVRPREASVELEFRSSAGSAVVTAGTAINCTYARTNKILSDSGLRTIPLKHELTELALVEVPAVLRDVGITVMCGPFFSLMPFPSTGTHTLSHVRYTPHCEWADGDRGDYHDPYQRLESARTSRFPHMLQDARRYLPAIGDATQVGSLWEIKTVLPMSEVDDSRPILLKASDDLPRLINVMGSKIDNVYDVLDPLGSMLPS